MSLDKLMSSWAGIPIGRGSVEAHALLPSETVGMPSRQKEMRPL